MTWEISLCIIACGIAAVPIGVVIEAILSGIKEVLFQKRVKAEEERKLIEAKIEKKKFEEALKTKKWYD